MAPASKQRFPGPLDAVNRERLCSALLAVASPLDPSATRQAVARAAAELLEARWGALYLASDGSSPHLAALHPDGANHRVALPADEGLVRLAVETRQGQIASTNGAAPLIPGVQGAQTALAVPLLRGQQLLGVLAAADDTPGRAFANEHVDLMALLATRVGTALENAYLREREREQRQEKSDFVSLVSHEFRTPLTSIKGYAQLAARRLGADADADVLRFLDTINAQADRLAALAADMVLHARLESGEIQMSLRPTDLRAVVGVAVDCGRSICGQHTILFEADPPPLPVVADPERLQQAVLNLLTSAARRAPEGSEITVGLRAEADRAIVWLRDRGPGLTPEQRNQILSRVYHREAAVGLGQGDALALAIAKAIVEAHDGRLWFEGEPDEGTTLYFGLPLGTEGA